MSKLLLFVIFVFFVTFSLSSAINEPAQNMRNMEKARNNNTWNNDDSDSINSERASSDPVSTNYGMYGSNPNTLYMLNKAHPFYQNFPPGFSTYGSSSQSIPNAPYYIKVYGTPVYPPNYVIPSTQPGNYRPNQNKLPEGKTFLHKLSSNSQQQPSTYMIPLQTNSDYAPSAYLSPYQSHPYSAYPYQSYNHNQNYRSPQSEEDKLSVANLEQPISPMVNYKTQYVFEKPMEKPEIEQMSAPDSKITSLMECHLKPVEIENNGKATSEMLPESQHMIGRDASAGLENAASRNLHNYEVEPIRSGSNNRYEDWIKRHVVHSIKNKPNYQLNHLPSINVNRNAFPLTRSTDESALNGYHLLNNILNGEPIVSPEDRVYFEMDNFNTDQNNAAVQPRAREEFFPAYNLMEQPPVVVPQQTVNPSYINWKDPKAEAYSEENIKYANNFYKTLFGQMDILREDIDKLKYSMANGKNEETGNQQLTFKGRNSEEEMKNTSSDNKSTNDKPQEIKKTSSDNKSTNDKPQEMKKEQSKNSESNAIFDQNSNNTTTKKN